MRITYGQDQPSSADEMACGGTMFRSHYVCFFCVRSIYLIPELRFIEDMKTSPG
jgi:hypothetical protein